MAKTQVQAQQGHEMKRVKNYGPAAVSCSILLLLLLLLYTAEGDLSHMEAERNFHCHSFF